MTDATGPKNSSPVREFAAAIIFLTRIPIRLSGDWPADLNQRALVWFPIVGALIGAAGGLLYWGLFLLGLPPGLAGGVTVAGLLLLTGALHEDGLADVADGLGGGRDRDHKLTIMKDSRIGTYGGAALVLSLGLRVGALAVLADPRAAALALIGAHAHSRGLLPAWKALWPDARATGTAADIGRPNGARSLVAAVIGLTLAATALGEVGAGGATGLLILAVAAAASFALPALAARQVGGITGDILGAAQQTGEIVFLLAVVAALAPAL
jgi:adenosylcobinamide-GDP ribazoletransferase